MKYKVNRSFSIRVGFDVNHGHVSAAVKLTNTI